MGGGAVDVCVSTVNVTRSPEFKEKGKKKPIHRKFLSPSVVGNSLYMAVTTSTTQSTSKVNVRLNRRKKKIRMGKVGTLVHNSKLLLLFSVCVCTYAL